MTHSRKCGQTSEVISSRIRRWYIIYIEKFFLHILILYCTWAFIFDGKIRYLFPRTVLQKVQSERVGIGTHKL